MDVTKCPRKLPCHTSLHKPVEGAGQSQVEHVRARHERALMAIDGVVGVGIGRTRIGDDAIVLYLRDVSVKQRVPIQIEGYPVETTVTGEIDAYGSTKPR